MPDYKEMYLKMMCASEAAIKLLIKTQQECEEMYMQEGGRDVPHLIKWQGSRMKKGRDDKEDDTY